MNGAEAGSSEEDSSYYEREYDQKAVDAKSGLPTWAKALIIIVAVVIGVCILAGIGSAIYGVFHYNSQPSIYHYGF